MNIQSHPGTLPPFWDRNVVFFANLLSLFYGNEGETESLREEVGHLEPYGGRLVPIINLLFKGGKNLLVLQKEPNDALVEYFTRDLDLDLADIAIIPYHRFQEFSEIVHHGSSDVPEDFQKITDHPAEWVDGFVTDDYIEDIAQSLGKSSLSSVAGSKRGNNKYLLYHFLLSESLPVFDIEVAASADDLPECIDRLKSKGYDKVVVKAQIGASGIGMEKLNVDADSASLAGYLFYEGPCLVQGWLEVGKDGIIDIHSPSVQMFIHHDSVHFYDITEQILSDDSVHQGNHAPPPYMRCLPEVREPLLEQAGRVGTWLYDQDYRGTASADFLIAETNESPRILVCEINARVTGATYPSVLARNFMPGGSWVMRNLLLDTPMEGGRILRKLMMKKRCTDPAPPRASFP